MGKRTQPIWEKKKITKYYTVIWVQAPGAEKHKAVTWSMHYYLVSGLIAQLSGGHSQLGTRVTQGHRFSKGQRDAPWRQKKKTEIKLQCPFRQGRTPLATSDFLSGEPSLYHLVKNHCHLSPLPQESLPPEVKQNKQKGLFPTPHTAKAGWS